MDLTPHHCHFCGQIEGEADRDLIAELLPGIAYVRRVMLESDSFAVIPSLGPLTDGHALLCPKRHVCSFAALPAELEAECRSIKARLLEAMRRHYGCDVLLFEHGTAVGGGRILCTVDHAHLHFVPLHGSRESALIPELPWREFDGSLAALARITGADEYLRIETSDGTSRVLTRRVGGFESQFMRKFIAERMQSEHGWNWRETPNPAAAHASWQRLAAG